jgi:hypothetical protein
MGGEVWSTELGRWIGAIGTIALFSLIFRENRFYRMFEHLFIGLSAGYLIAKTTWGETLRPMWWEPIVKDGQWAWIFAAGGGALFYTMYSKKHNWMSRIGIGVLIALFAGQIFQQTANEYLPQVKSTFKPLIVTQDMVPKGSELTTYGMSLNNMLFIVIVVCVLTYFFFSFEQKNRVVQTSARTGRLMLMFAFGAIFGSTVMARMALLIDRVWFLMHDWLKVQ